MYPAAAAGNWPHPSDSHSPPAPQHRVPFSAAAPNGSIAVAAMPANPWIASPPAGRTESCVSRTLLTTSELLRRVYAKPRTAFPSSASMSSSAISSADLSALERTLFATTPIRSRRTMDRSMTARLSGYFFVNRGFERPEVRALVPRSNSTLRRSVQISLARSGSNRCALRHLPGWAPDSYATSSRSTRHAASS